MKPVCKNNDSNLRESSDVDGTGVIVEHEDGLSMAR